MSMKDDVGWPNDAPLANTRASGGSPLAPIDYPNLATDSLAVKLRRTPADL